METNPTSLTTLRFIDDSLYFDGISLASLAQKYQTPLYVYSQSSITNSFLALRNAFSTMDSVTICYAVKSNSNLSILKILSKLGCGFDIVSEGELFRVLAAGCDPTQVVFSGVGKSQKEIEMALKYEIKCFNVESASELKKINEIATKMGKVAPISIRVNPDVDPATHEYISTSLKINKFGVPIPEALELYKKAKELSAVRIKGIDCHLGSQIFSKGPYIDALMKIFDLIAILEEEGISLEHLDLGGGFGVSYFEGTQEMDITALAQEITKLMVPKKLHLIIEPGRYLVANAGLLLTKVEYLKKTEARSFAIVDAAMNDLLRPALYKAYHKIVEVVKKETVVERVYDVVGPVCESGDFLGKDRSLKIEEGDLLAVLSCGAYGMTMSSNYNTRPRAAEVLILEEKIEKIIREREKVESIFENEIRFL